MRVIVTLGLWTPWQPEGALTPARVAHQRVEISSAQQGLTQLLRIAGIPYAVTTAPATTPRIGLDLPTLGTLARVQAAFQDLRTWDSRPGGLILAVSADALASPTMDASMLPIGYAYDPVAGDMQQLALDAGTPPVLIGVEDPVIGDWGAGGTDADAFLVVTATTPLVETEIPVQTSGPADTALPLQTAAPALAAGIGDPSTWSWTTWLLVSGGLWFLLRGR